MIGSQLVTSNELRAKGLIACPPLSMELIVICDQNIDAIFEHCEVHTLEELREKVRSHRALTYFVGLLLLLLYNSGVRIFRQDAPFEVNIYHRIAMAI